jgi:predicted RNA polymerase sigma factor
VWGELRAFHACPWRTTATCTRPVPNCCLGSTAEAPEAYHRALTLVHDDTKRRLLERRLAQFDRATGPAWT